MPSRRFLALFAAPLAMLGGCQSISSLGDSTAATLGLADDTPRAYTASQESQAHRSGIAVADEPLAARSGAAALTLHGNAVDAVTTMFFTLAATYPVAAGLGGGGICLVSDPNGQVAEFDFLTKAPRRAGAYALPGAVKGFATLHKLYGGLPWQRVVAPGEAYAATGFPVSQTLAARLGTAQNILRLDASLAAEFLDEAGQPRAAGSETRNVPLSETLSQIRQNGADGFYKGPVAERIVAYSDGAGWRHLRGGIGGQPTAARPGALPRNRPPCRLASGRAHRRRRIQRVVAEQSCHVVAGRRTWRQRHSRALAGFGVASLPRDLGSTGFAAVDANGQAAACAVTMNGPFGSGRTATGTGVVLGANPVHAVGYCQRLPDAGDRHGQAASLPWRAWVPAAPMARRRRCMRWSRRRPGGLWASRAICAERAGRLTIPSM